MNSNIDVQALIASITTEVTSQVLAALNAETVTPATKTAPVKAEPRYRTAKQIETGRAKYDALWASLKKANPGVASKDLARANRAALNACYPKGTRKTKA